MSPPPSLLPKSPVIDASMLFDFLIWRLPSDFRDQFTARSPVVTQTSLFALLRRTLCSSLCAKNFGPTTPEKVVEQVLFRQLKELGWYLSAAKPIQTTSQVVAEIQGLAKSKLWLKGARLERFWRLARQEFEQIELADHFVSMAEMDRDDFVTYGPADASILRLATRLGAAVLAVDSRLKDHCVEREIQVRNYDSVLELWEQRNNV